MVGTLVRRASMRHFRRHPWQLTLGIIGVALSVAIVVAVDLANESARRAFELSTHSVVGRATHQIIGGPAGLDERIYVRLRTDYGLRPAAPVLDGYGTVKNETLHLFGIDPLAETGIRNHTEGLSELNVRRLMTEPGALLLADITAERLGIALEERFDLKLAGRTHTMTLIGVLRTDRTSRAALDGLAITDIATAQEALNLVGRLGWIDLILPDGHSGDVLRSHIVDLLPPEAELVPAEARSQTLIQMTEAFHINLTAMSLIALLVGLFLIYNTMTFAVLQRRHLLGQLRALGVTRKEVFALILYEGFIVGAIGTAAGEIIGIALGQGLIHLVIRTINDLYFSVTVSELLITPTPLVKAAMVGILGTLIAVLIPAVEATTSTPRSALMRSVIEGRARATAPKLALGGFLLALLSGAMLIIPSKSITLAFSAMFLMLCGIIAMVPMALQAVTTIPLASAARAFDIKTRLALRGIGASLSRTGVAVAALMLAVATTVGVGIMITSFRESVAAWLDTTLRADIYISTPRIASGRIAPSLDTEFTAAVRALPGLDYVSSVRRATVESSQGLEELIALDVPRAYAPRFTLQGKNNSDAIETFYTGKTVFVSEPYAYHRGVKAGSIIELRTDHGLKKFMIAGVYRDYSSGQGEIAMIRSLYDANYQDPQVSALGLWLKPGTNIADVMNQVRARAPPGQELLVRSNREIRDASFEIFDRTFTITSVLRLLTIVVAFVGVLSALMALALERSREVGVLRALGFTPRQIGALVTLQTGFMGLAAGVLALPMGALLALLLTHVVNRRSFGWSIETVFDPAIFVEAVVLAVASAMAAALYPALQQARARTAVMLREE